MKATRLLIVTFMAAGLCACANTRKPKAPPPPPPTYTGPEFFRTTISSQCSLRGYESVLVSGFGLVVNLDGTGSPDVPPQIAQWLINEMSKGGFGKTSLGFGRLTPRQVLNSDRTAVVVVEALIPPGATPGATFDAVVTALPGTQTTSLEGGLLYTTELRFAGTSINTPSSRPMARAYGPVFLNPFVKTEPLAFGGRSDNARIGHILNGAVAIEEMPLALILNQPSYTRSRMIADRINGRFRQADVDRFPLAVAEDDKTITLHVLDRFKTDPQRMLDLIGHLYLNPTERFAQEQAQRLIDELAKPENHKYADGIATAWEAMGKLVLPVIRHAYNHEDPVVRLAALSAGARLGDMLGAAQPLNAIASAPDGGADAERAAAMLGTLLAYNPDHTRIRAMLRNLLDADDARVRMTAFSALFNAGERAPYIIYRENPGKVELALVRSNKPMVYVTRQGPPRIVIFDQMLGFDYPLFASLWDNRLMIRGDRDDMAVNVYYRPLGATHGQTYQIAPTVGNLVLLMAGAPSEDNPTPALDMNYSDVVRVLYELTENKMIRAPLVLQPSSLIQRIASQRMGATTPTGEQRPETDQPAGDTENAKPTE